MVYIKEAIVKSVIGIHARPASALVKLASTFNSKITINFQDKVIDAKSMLNVLSAGIKGGHTLSVQGEGDDEVQAVNKVVELIESVKD